MKPREFDSVLKEIVTNKALQFDKIKIIFKS